MKLEPFAAAGVDRREFLKAGGSLIVGFANAAVDATGVRLGQYPLTPARVRAALAQRR